MYRLDAFQPKGNQHPDSPEGGASGVLTLPFSNEVDVCHQSTIPARPEEPPR